VSDPANLKKQLAKYILKTQELPDIVGFGGGSTVAELLKLIKDKKVLAASFDLQSIALKKNLKIASQDEPLTVVYDGADYVIEDQKVLIKGRGGALLREKILMASTSKTNILVEETKWDIPDTISIPVEISPYLDKPTRDKLGQFSKDQIIRPQKANSDERFFTENNNLIVDIQVSKDLDFKDLYRDLITIPGVLEVGIFFGFKMDIFSISKTGQINIVSWS
jgi:ribose 5-phosphate isomerase A